jgi:hypothetical protein
MPDGFEPQRTGRERTHNIPGPHLRDARGMEEQAREARSERPRRALDHQIQQSQAEGGWRAAGGSRHPCLWSAGSAGISSFVPFPLLKWPPEYQTGGAATRDPRSLHLQEKTE